MPFTDSTYEQQWREARMHPFMRVRDQHREALIAAAPEMLDALRMAADAIDLAQAQVDSENDRYTLCKRLVAVKRVISKAEGRE